MTHGLGILIAALVLLTAPLSAHEEGSYADYYAGLRTSTGASCCGGRDCAPAEARVGPHGWEVKRDGRWVEVPLGIIIQHATNPTGFATLCVRDGTMVCFVPSSET